MFYSLFDPVLSFSFMILLLEWIIRKTSIESIFNFQFIFVIVNSDTLNPYVKCDPYYIVQNVLKPPL